MTGLALDCYGRFPQTQSLDYDAVKKALMKRYDLIEDGYRRRFRICKPDRYRSDSYGSTRWRERRYCAGPSLEVTDIWHSEIKDGMLQLASGKAVPVVKYCAALGDSKRTRDLRVPILRRKIGGREVDVMRGTGCEDVVVHKGLVEEVS
ncbi:hypothetical protein PoB_001695600 [Plakobranchus ocellatus]|uniref:Uncharacterized protein n=1 Tax=Plakobranchus ocellatus TaxID=259542 RepID=A0AAV3Z3J7_9GAST|nr:hypothetical protein PoB_001695600 [Plakobranchus ocellatus]